jgi:hypothetical protein
MRILSYVTALAVSVSCVSAAIDGGEVGNVVEEKGCVSVNVRFEDASTKAQTDYVTALDEESKVNRMMILVFDKSTGMLNATMDASAISQTCKMYLPVGQKIVYAVINGPSLSGVSKVSDIDSLLDDLSLSTMSDAGLTLVGSEECNVVAGDTPTTVTVSVRWLVSRVVLRNVTCNIPSQYGEMTLDCVYLGNANSTQKFSGETGGKKNDDGYSEAGQPIGQAGVTGACPSYFYRMVDEDIAVGESLTEKYHMYCHPNQTQDYTCLYVLTTIGGIQYYYRVPLDQGLSANTTCSVDLKITNLGSLTPPDGDLQKGEIQAVVTIEGWAAGNDYVAEF